LELKHLRSFIAVAEQLSFVQAAKRLHVSQPALSSQIRNLEEQLGVQLLFRNRRVVKLTDAGKVFLNEAYAVLHHANEAAERARKAAHGQIGKLSIGFVSSAALEIVPEIVVAFRKKHPDVTLDLRNIRTTDQIEGLTNKTIDVGFVRMPLSHSQLKTTVVHREPFVVIFPDGHPLSIRKRFQIAQLQNEHFVLYGRRWASGFYDNIIQMCNAAGFSPNIVQETGEMYTTIALVGAGAGIAIVPQSVVLAQSRKVITRVLPSSVGISEIAIAIAHDNHSSLVQSFVALATAFRQQLERSKTRG
jgi:DNA-binding transcriptional LysR family regulator